ncbi:MAG: glycosyltransferase family 2 protein [Clostridia bacterium]|nr:glycosyltransferase family 2 protein [Clostridia bacterium]
MTLSVCIPMYNESATVANCCDELYSKLCSIRERRATDFEIILCDDGSTDKTRQLAQDASSGRPEVRVIGYSENRGKGFAVKTAILDSHCDAVIYTDCDLAYGVDVIEDAVDAIYKDGDFAYDIVIGSRNLTRDGYSGYGAVRKLASKAYIKMLSLIGGFKLSDSQCGFKIFNTESAKRLFGECECEGFAFDYEIILLARKYGMTVGEMPVRIVNHRDSTVNVFHDSFSMFRDVVRIRRRIGKKK